MVDDGRGDVVDTGRREYVYNDRVQRGILAHFPLQGEARAGTNPSP